MDPGASLTDPRAVPTEARNFAEKIKAGAEVTYQETIDLIDKSYEVKTLNFRSVIQFLTIFNI